LKRTSIQALPGFTELGTLLRLIFIPYESRERNRRRSVATELLAGQWNEEMRALGTIVHIEDSPYDLPFLLQVRSLVGNIWPVDIDNPTSPSREPIDRESLTPDERLAARRADWEKTERDIERHEQFKRDQTYYGAWGRTHVLDPHVGSIPNWTRDQTRIADQLWTAAGDQAHILAERVRAIYKHLHAIETKLPSLDTFDSPLGEGIYLGLLWSLQSSLGFKTRRYIPPTAMLNWSHRAALSADIATTFAAIPVDAAKNVVLHGYYLACTNLHLALGWPLLDGLDKSRLDALAGVESKEGPLPPPSMARVTAPITL
jgi:hypothetical protein